MAWKITIKIPTPLVKRIAGNIELLNPKFTTGDACVPPTSRKTDSCLVNVRKTFLKMIKA